MDYLDGTLAPERVAAVEAHLAADAEDAQLLADLKLAQSTLHEMAQEPIRTRDDFWQKVKAELIESAINGIANLILDDLREFVNFTLNGASRM